MPEFRIKNNRQLTEYEECRKLLRDAHKRGDLMSCAQVAKLLGVSERTLRSRIADGGFPPAVVETADGKKDFWVKVTVLHYQAIQIASGNRPSARSRIKTNDEIDEEDESRYEALDLESQKMERSFHEMERLLEAGTSSFIAEHPKLKKWLKDRNKPISHWKALAGKEK